jgi:hypothetical protein
MKILYGIGDELEDFAERIVSSVPLSSAAPRLHGSGGMVATLLREGRYQVEAVSLRGRVVIPPHVHDEFDTIDVPMFGCVQLWLGDRNPFAHWSDAAFARFIRGKGIRVNAGELHRGKVITSGAMFLSIQRWKDAPGSVIDDWRGAIPC